ncbi:hypothetical protein C5167_036399 [Papaver somniferum]|uniref:Uncharacterized protein n=1 Tax=Papaver somniferum TaxID=3469 RepID=A0A4Y7I6J7_PAPSO|nr:hypothetical protein C5167_036399 [Papaver somniferum]
MVHDGNGVGRTGRVLPSHAPIESPVDGGRGGGRTRPVLPSRSPIESPVHERSRAGGISCAVHPMESPLNNDFLLTPRISPRGHRTGVHRNLEKEYNGLHSPMRTQGRVLYHLPQRMKYNNVQINCIIIEHKHLFSHLIGQHKKLFKVQHLINHSIMLFEVHLRSNLADHNSGTIYMILS